VLTLCFFLIKNVTVFCKIREKVVMILLLYYVEAKLCIRLQAHKKEEARSIEKIKGLETFLQS
jgi:hypothetical protein